MSPLDKLYLIACWSYIISFHLTFTLLTLNHNERGTLLVLETMD
jgi:hypothetical protein